jgi:hypothetical protein
LCRINLKVDQCLLRRRLTAIFGVTVDHSSKKSLCFALISCNKQEVVYDAEEDLGVDANRIRRGLDLRGPLSCTHRIRRSREVQSIFLHMTVEE